MKSPAGNPIEPAPKACTACLAASDQAAETAREFEHHLRHHEHITKPCKTCWRLMEDLRRDNHDRLVVLADHHERPFTHHAHGAVDYMAEALFFHDFASRPRTLTDARPRWRRILGV